MKNNRRAIMSILFSFFVFLTLNLPSIKLIYSSSIFNIIAFLGIFIFGYLRNKIRQIPAFNFTHRQFRYAWQFSLLWGLMFFLTWIQGNLDLNTAVEYVSVSLFVFGVLLFIKERDYAYIFTFQIMWGSILAYIESTVGIPKNTSLGQHYLTSGVAIATTIAIVMGMFFSKKVNKFVKLLLVPILILLISGVTSLNGRAPILLSFIVPITIIGLFILYEKDKKKKLIFTTGVLILLALSIYFIMNNLPQNTLNRVTNVFTDFQNEPRYDNYSNALQLISEEPLGIGLKGYSDFGLNYPHNIFLEVMLSGGVLALLPFVLLLKTIFGSVVHSIRHKDNSIICVSLTLYLFMTWNFSFDLSSSYMLFTATTLLISRTEINYKKKFKSIETYYKGYRRESLTSEG